MKNIIIVFKSKTEVFEFCDLMNARGATTVTVGTPREARIGCGISAKTDARNLSLAISVLNENNFGGFFGIYSVVSVGGRTSKTKIM